MQNYSMPLPIYPARDSAVTQRQASTAILAIDSEDRFKDYDDARLIDGLNRSPYSFAINKNQSMMNGFFTRLAVSEIVFPWVIPNINVYTSEILFTCKIGGVDTITTIALDRGFYTPSMIASALQQKVRDLAPTIPQLATFTMTYGIRTIDNTVATQMPIFEYKTNDPTVTVIWSPVPTLGGVAVNPLRKQLFDILGFSEIQRDVFAEDGYGAETFCQATRYIDIVCTQLTGNQALKDTMSQVVARDVLCRVYIGDAQGVQSTVIPSASTFCPAGCMPTTIYKNYAQPKQIMWIPNQPVPGYLQFNVYDDAGFSLDDYFFEEQEGGQILRSNGINWSMTALVTEN